MADNKFGEFGVNPTTERATVQIEGAPPPKTPATKFGEFGISNIPKVTLTPEQESKFQDLKDSGNFLYDIAADSPVLPLVLGGIGAFGAGPPGAAVGAATGQLMRSTLQKRAPLTPGEAIPEALITGGSTYLGGKYLGDLNQGMIERLGSALVAAMMGKGIETATNPPTEPQPVTTQLGGLVKDMGLNLGLTLAGEGAGKYIKSRGEHPGVPLGEEIPRVREQVLSGGPSTEAGTPARTRTEYARGGQAAIRGNLAQASGIEDAAWNEVRKVHLDQNTERMQKITGYREKTILTPEEDRVFRNTGIKPKEPILEDVEIKGPITMMETQKLAQEALPKLDEWMKGDSYAKLPDSMKAKYANIYGTLKSVAEPFEAYVNGKEVSVPLKSYETVKEIRTTINQAVSGNPAPNFPQAQLKKVAESLGKDIDTSILNFWKNGPEAMKALDRANRATELKKRTFETAEMKTRMYGRPNGQLDTRVEADPDAFFRQAYQSPERAKRLMTALGPDNHEYIKGDYIDNHLLPKAFGKGETKFNPIAAIDELKNPNSSAREILSAGERNNLLRVLEAARATEGGKGNVAAQILKDQAQLNIGIAASRVLTGNSIGARVLIGAKEFWQTMRNNKPAADTMQRLLKIRPGTAEAENGAKEVVKAMKGLSLSVVMGGREYQGEVGENGKIKFFGEGQ